jgi:intracellular sulfur oxidation DsrE/DsrF family protein
MHYKAVFHVDLPDDQVFNLELNNIANTMAALEGEEKKLILLVNGPGVTMLAGEKMYEYRERLQHLHALGTSFQVCEKALERFEVERGDLFEGCEIIPAGIVGLIDLQNSGFAYIKP